MAKRTHVDKNGNTWEWDETPEVAAAVRKLHDNQLHRPNPPRQETNTQLAHLTKTYSI
jgi:hypothetical protein